MTNLVNPFWFGAWTPSQISGCHSWMDASISDSMFTDAGKTTVAGEDDLIYVWADQSGNGNDWIQATENYRPIAHPTHGRVWFDGIGVASTDIHLIGTDISLWTTGSFLGRVQVIDNANGGIWGATGLNNQGTAAHWNFSLGGNKSVNFADDNITQGTASAWGAGAIPDWGDLMTFESNIDTDGTTTEYANEETIYGPTDRGNTTFRTAPYIGGVVRSGVSQYSASSYFYRFAAYDRILTTAERTLLRVWLDVDPTPAPVINDPTDITGCILWLDAADRGSTTDQWDDKSGEGNHFTSASGQFPTFTAGEAIFNGTTEFLTGPDFCSVLTESEVFLRVKTDSANPGLTTSGLWEFGNNANPAHYTYLSRIFESWGNTNRSMDTNPPLSIDSYRTVNIWTAANDWSYQHDGSTIYSTGTNTVGWITDPRIGKAKNFANYLDGNIQSIAQYDHKLNSLEREQLETYMASL